MASDDDIYDDVLDESFEFEDEDYDDLDLDGDLGSDFEGDGYEDYDDFGMDGDDADYVAGGAKSSSGKKFDLDFNTIVIIGAVIVGAMIMMYQVTSKKPPPKAAGQEKFATALQMNGAFDGPGAIEEKTAAASEETDEEDGFLFDNDSIDVAIDDEESQLPMPSPITVSSDTILQTSEEELKVEVPEKVETAHGVVVNDLENIEIVAPEKATPIIESEIVINTPDEVIPIIEPEVLVTEVVKTEPVIQEPRIVETETVNMESAKLQSLLSRIEMMEAQMSEVQQSHRSEIRTLEEKIASLKKSQANVVKQNPSPNKTQKRKTSKKISSVKKRWELRAAQPGRAWVSLKGQSDMRPIVVGDKLSGIGRIQNIAYLNGKWIVQGSAGKIVQ